MELHITGEDAADQLLSQDAFALLTGMLLDQQVTMESAFAGPEKIRTRLGTLDPGVIAGQDPAGFVELFKERPAVHRFPGSMAGRVQALAATVHSDWDGDAAAIWTKGNPDGPEVLRRLKALPGYGEQRRRSSWRFWASNAVSKPPDGVRPPATTEKTAPTYPWPTSWTLHPWPRSAPANKQRKPQQRLQRQAAPEPAARPAYSMSGGLCEWPSTALP